MLSKHLLQSRFCLCHNIETWRKCKCSEIESGKKKIIYLILVFHATLSGRVLVLVAHFFLDVISMGERWGLSVITLPTSDPLAVGGKMLQPFQ